MDTENFSHSDHDLENMPLVLLMGLRRSGKSSICRVVFHDMPPLETIYIESTPKPTYEKINSLFSFGIQEMPGQIDMFEPTYDTIQVFSSVQSLVYVIDSQDEYLYALQNLQNILEIAYKANPSINFEILIHKVDGLSEDFLLDTQRDIMQRVTDELADIGIEDADISFYMTSIFDHSIYEAFSRIIQRLVPELSTLESMLNVLCQHSGVEKAFLFDIDSKIYIATDSSPVDVETYQVCSDFIDVTTDLDQLYMPPRPQDLDDADDLNHPQYQKPAGYDPENSINLIKCSSMLIDGITVFFSQIVGRMAVVALIRGDGIQQMTLVDYNIEMFRQGLKRMYKW